MLQQQTTNVFACLISEVLKNFSVIIARQRRRRRRRRCLSTASKQLCHFASLLGTYQAQFIYYILLLKMLKLLAMRRAEFWGMKREAAFVALSCRISSSAAAATEMIL